MLLSDTRCVDDPYAEFQVDDDLLSCDDIVSLNPYSCREVNQSCCASCAKYGTADIHVPHQSFKNCVYSDVAAVWHTQKRVHVQYMYSSSFVEREFSLAGNASICRDEASVSVTLPSAGRPFPLSCAFAVRHYPFMCTQREYGGLQGACCQSCAAIGRSQQRVT